MLKLLREFINQIGFAVQYTYLRREGGRGGRVQPERRRGATFHKAGSKIPT
jgi:hypothetical protein